MRRILSLLLCAVSSPRCCCTASASCAFTAAMLQALRCRAGVRAVRSTPWPPQRLGTAAAAHRCLANAAATGASKGYTPGPAAAVAATSDPNGTQQAAPRAGSGSTSVETDEMGNPRHILLYEGSKVMGDACSKCYIPHVLCSRSRSAAVSNPEHARYLRSAAACRLYSVGSPAYPSLQKRSPCTLRS